MHIQVLVLPTLVSSFQVAPESADVQMFPVWTTAATLVPSAEHVMERQVLVLPMLVSACVQVVPEFVDL